MPSDVRAAATRRTSTDDLDIIDTKHGHSAQVIKVQKKLKENLPQLEVSVHDQKHKPYLRKPE